MTSETNKQLATNLTAVSITYFYNEYKGDCVVEDDEGNTSYTEAAQEDFNTLYDLFEEMLDTWRTNGI